jgi:hypothetical protein
MHTRNIKNKKVSQAYHLRCKNILNKQKCHYFWRHRTRRHNSFCLGAGYASGKGDDIRKGCQKDSVPMCVSRKMRTVETTPRIGGGLDKGEWWRRWFQLCYIVTNFATTLLLQTILWNYSKNKKVKYIFSSDDEYRSTKFSLPVIVFSCPAQSVLHIVLESAGLWTRCAQRWITMLWW